MAVVNVLFRGGRICLTDHFKPLWARNVSKFGIAHAMALGVRTSIIPFYFIDFECFSWGLGWPSKFLI